jgi:hypothetical protein
MAEVAERSTVSRQALEQFCCIGLVKASVDGFVATASGGVWLGQSSDTGCCSHLPQISFCPFCGSKIVVTPPRPDAGLHGWAWHTEAPDA